MIGLYQGKSPLNRLAQHFNRSHYGHASWIFRDGRNAEAVGSGFRITSDPREDHSQGTIIHLFDFDLTESQHDQIENFFLSLKDAPYDWPGLLGFMTGNAIQDKNSILKWFCSEAVSGGCIHIGKPLLRDLLPYHTSPRDISISPLIRFRETLIVTGEGNVMNHNYDTAIQELTAIVSLKVTQIGELLAHKGDLDTEIRVAFLKKQIKEIKMACNFLGSDGKPEIKEAQNG